jgi:SAM-dependent methyltransferase
MNIVSKAPGERRSADGVEGLDYAFLQWLPVVAEEQRQGHSFYLPFFEGCQRVVDLGCGSGYYVEMLTERGFDALGVDSDPQCCAAVRALGAEVVEADVLDYLRQQPAGSIDGFFASHLIEHLPYDVVVEMLRLAYRALSDGGVMVLTTPNVRGLYSHLEMFYLHFGHVSFYHPRLMCFLLEFCGFDDTEWGENPYLPSPLLGGRVEALLDAPQVALDGRPPLGPVAEVRAPIQAQMARIADLPRPDNPLRRLWWRAKMLLVRLIVRPYVDEVTRTVQMALNDRDSGAAALADDTNKALDEARNALDRLARFAEQQSASLAQWSGAQLRVVGSILNDVDRPFECYAVGRKGTSESRHRRATFEEGAGT